MSDNNHKICSTIGCGVMIASEQPNEICSMCGPKAAASSETKRRMKVEEFWFVPSDKLLQCPFCGSDAQLYDYSDTYVCCSNTCCPMCHPLATIKEWNTRAPSAKENDNEST
jgi:hypothetical protein